MKVYHTDCPEFLKLCLASDLAAGPDADDDRRVYSLQ